MSGFSQDDFNLLQEQLIELKRHKYESSEREKKFIAELKNQREQIENLENEQSKKSKTSSLFSDLVNKTKGNDKGKLNEVMEENESLKRTINENLIINKEQTKALKLNVKSMFDSNKQLEDEILLLKKEIQQYTIKADEQQQKISRLNVDMAELHCSNEELENQLKQYQVNGMMMMGIGSTTQDGADDNSSSGGSGGGSIGLQSPMIMSQQQVQVVMPPLDVFISAIEQDEMLWRGQDEALEAMKERLSGVWNEQNEKLVATPPPTTNQSSFSPLQVSTPKKEVIFHPLGEPTYDPGEEKEKTKLRETIKGLMEQIKESDVRSTKVASESGAQQATIDQLTLTVSTWQEKHKNAEINRVKIEEKLENDIKRLNNEINQIRLAKEVLEKDKEAIQESIMLSSSKFTSTVHNLEESLSNEKVQFDQKLNEKIDEILNLKTKYEQQIIELNEKIKKYKIIKNELMGNLKNINSEVIARDKMIESRVEENNLLKERVHKLDDEVERVTHELTARNEELVVNKSMVVELEDKLRRSEDKVSRESSNFYSMTEQFNKLNANMTNIESRNKELESLNHQLDKDHSTITIEHNEFVDKFNQLESTNQQLQSKIDQHLIDISQLTETNQLLDKQLQELTSQLENTTNHFNEVNEKFKNASGDLDKLSKVPEQLELLKAENGELQAKISKFEVALADSETERKIAEKKNTRMIKELKSELSKERTSVNLLSQSSNSIPTTPTQPSMPLMGLSQSSNGSMSLPTTPLSTPVKSHSRTLSRGGEPFLGMVNNNLSTLTNSPSSSTLSSRLSTTPNQMKRESSSNNIPNLNINPSIESLTKDLEAMGRKLGEMGTDRYKFEEKIRTLEQNVLILNQELDKKNKVVRFYISKTQLGKATSTEEKTKRFKGGVIGSFWRNNDPQLVAEMVEKMEIMLQENILKNIQLSDDVEVLGNEASRLTSENKTIKLLLQSNNIQLPNPESYFTPEDNNQQLVPTPHSNQDHDEI